MTSVVRLSAFVLGLVCAGLGCYGAWEFALKLEAGAVTYLVVAAPVVAAAAALTPSFAEHAWRQGKYLKALLWWAVLVPAGAVVFFGAAEQVHVAKAGAQAERDALRGVAGRAQAALTKAETALDKARAEANKARGLKQCGPTCRSKLAAEETAQADLNAAKQALLDAEKRATADSPLQAPVWLLPAALDLVAFMALWSAFSGGSKPALKPAKRVQGKRSKKRSKARQPKVLDAKAKASNAREQAEAEFRRVSTGAASSPGTRLAPG